MTDSAKQGSEAWFKIRLGRCTASRVADALAEMKSGGWGASRENYRSELVIERLTGVPTEHYQSAAMLYGSELEPEARHFYSFKYDVEVEETGFWPHPSIIMAGGSPDGLIGAAGLLELKCPNSATHIKTLRTDAVSDRHLKQVQFQLACTQRDWCDLVSYDKRLPPHMRLWVKRILRDDDYIRKLEHGVRTFLAEVEEELEDLRRLYPMRDAA